MDVVSLVSCGVEGVAATLGTSLTPEQAKLLSRYAPEIWVAYDGDAAGQNAILRALDIFEEAQIPVRVLVIPDGQDPDEFIRAQGKEAFEALKPLSAAAYRMARAKDGLDLSEEEGRTKYAMACAAILRGVKQPVEQENLLKAVDGRDRVLPRSACAADWASSAARPAGRTRQAAVRPPERFEPQGRLRAERTLLELLCFGFVPEGTLSADTFSDEDHRFLAQELLHGRKPEELLLSLEDGPRRSLLLEAMANEPKVVNDEALRMIAECVETLRRDWIEKRIASLQANMSGASSEEKDVALREIMKLTNEKKSLGPGRKE